MLKSKLIDVLIDSDSPFTDEFRQLVNDIVQREIFQKGLEPKNFRKIKEIMEDEIFDKCKKLHDVRIVLEKPGEVIVLIQESTLGGFCGGSTD